MVLSLKSISTEGIVDDMKFWGIVDSYNWGDKGFDHDRRKATLLRELSYNEIKSLRDTFSEKMSELDIHSNFVKGPSDDGWSDLRAHIIGLGKEEFEASLKEPQRIQDRADKHDYRESFSYVLPYENDLNSILPFTYCVNLNIAEKELLEVWEEQSDRLGTSDKEELAKLLDFIRSVQGLMRYEEPKAVVKLWKDTYPLGSKDEIWNRHWNPVRHLVPNVLSDWSKMMLY